MGAIAERAGVAVQTLYFAFHTKGAILGEVLGASIIGFEHWQGPRPAPVRGVRADDVRTWHPWFGAFEQEPDVRRALRMFIEASSAALRRTAPLTAAMQAATGDPEVHQVDLAGERRRRETFGLIAKLLARKRGELRPGRTLARATDVLLVVFSGTTWQALSERGWSPDERTSWFVEVLTAQLLPA